MPAVVFAAAGVVETSYFNHTDGLAKLSTSLPTPQQGQNSRIAVCLDLVASELNVLLADIFAVYIKTKNFIGTCRLLISANPI